MHVPKKLRGFFAVDMLRLFEFERFLFDQMIPSDREALYAAFYDEENDKRLGFFANNFELPALAAAQLCKCRWQAELFFKWIKQHLRIKAFSGTNENAVKTQIWIAISVYVLAAIVKKRLRAEASLSPILQILSLALFEKMPLDQLLNDTALQNLDSENHIQLNLFD